MPWDFALILVVLGVLVPWRSAVRFRRIITRAELTALDRLTLYATTIAFQWAATAVVLWRVYARGLDAGDLRVAMDDPGLVAAASLALAIFISASQWLSLRRLAALPPERRGLMGHIGTKLMPQSAIERLAFVALVVTVALCEELIYRGFALTVLARAMNDSLLFGVTASAILFGIAHAYQGCSGVRTTTIVGAALGVVVVWTGSLVPAMVAHLVADLVVGLAAPRMLAGRPTPPVQQEIK